MKIATILTRILDPFIAMTGVFVLGFVRSSLPLSQKMWIFPVSVVVFIGVPVGYILFAIRRKMLRDWDMNDRRERPRILLTLLGYEVLSLLLFRPFFDAYLFRYFIFVILVLTGFTLITMKWKISGHAMCVSLVTILFTLMFGIQFWWVLLLIPVVSWTRVIRKNHSVAQVIAGALYSLAAVLAAQPWIR